MKLKESRLCFCGCTGMARPGNRYIHGHNGKCRSKSSNRQIAKATKRRWRDLEYKKKIGKRIQSALLSPEINAKMKRALRAHWDDPVEHLLHAYSIAESNRRPEVRAKMSTTMKRLFDNPEFKKKAIEAMYSGFLKWLDTGGREEISIKSSEWMSSEEFKRKQKEAFSTKEYHDKQSGSQKKAQLRRFLEDPVKYLNHLVEMRIRSSYGRIGKTEPERKVDKILNALDKSFKYVGDGTFFVDRKNPDFVSIAKRKIIEVNGDYWHNDKSKDLEKRRIYRQNGYDTLIVWESELCSDPRASIKRIYNFIRRGRLE